MIQPNHGIECRTSVLRVQNKLVVCCEIDHFIPSGLSVHDLFAQLRPRLVAAIEEAARRDVNEAVPPRAPRVQMDVCDEDPGLTLWVYSPAAGVVDIDNCLQRLQAIVARFVTGQREVDSITPSLEASTSKEHQTR